MTPLRAWILAARPKTLLLSFAPVAVGAGLLAFEHAKTGVPVRWLPVVFALLGAVLIQIGTNLANDVFDHEKGADGTDRLGEARMVASGVLTATAVRRAMMFVFALALASGVYLVACGGLPILVLGLVAIASGIFYTGGPYPLGYNGLGDAFVFVFFGPVAVLGTTWVGGAAPSPIALLASLPVGFLATGVLVLNNVRDEEGDRRAKKRTLVVRFGRAFGRFEYAACVVASLVVPLVLYRSSVRHFGLLLPLLTLPLAMALLLRAHRAEGRTLNPYLGKTALLAVAHSVLLGSGLAWAGHAAAFVSR